MDETIRIRKGLGRTPEVLALVRASGRSRHEVIGLLVEFWGWVEDEGKGTGIVLLNCIPQGSTISQFLSDAIGGDPGFWRALREVGWLRIDGKTLIVPKAGRYTAPKKDESRQLGLGLEDTDAADLDAGFEEFWSVYPRRENKAAARKAWGKIKPRAALRREIMDGLKRALATEQWRRGIVPHASTWLNNRRWDDERSSGCDASGRESGKTTNYSGIGIRIGGVQTPPPEKEAHPLLPPGEGSDS